MDNFHNSSKKDLKIYGAKYHLWREQKYIGIATWTDDPNIGDAFLIETVDGFEVCIPDEWELVTEPDS